MPSKQIYVKPYQVKGHYRTIYTRTFKFICAHCEQEAKRTTYATACPKYCDKCKDLKKKLGSKKQATGEVVETANKAENGKAKSVDLSQSLENLVATPATESKTQEAAAKTKASNQKGAKETTKTKVSKESTKTEVTKEVNVELDSEKLVEYTNQLLLIHYNRKLNSDSKNMLVDLWERKNYDQMVKERGLRIKAVRKIASNLFTQLSNAMEENVNPRNLHEVMNKHYRAYQMISG